LVQGPEKLRQRKANCTTLADRGQWIGDLAEPHERIRQSDDFSSSSNGRSILAAAKARVKRKVKPRVVSQVEARLISETRALLARALRTPQRTRDGEMLS
jgi:hypothetical protein